MGFGHEVSVSRRGIGELLREDQLAVPPNQRSYAWEDQHIKDLLQDLSEAMDNDDDEYFLGTIVLIETPQEAASIADGQQRLATISIVLARIRDRQLKAGRKQAAISIDTSFLRSIDMETEERTARLQLNLEDNEYFRTHILSGPIDEDFDEANRKKDATRPSNKRLFRASELIEQFIDDLLKPARADHQPGILAKWIKFLEHKTTVVIVMRQIHAAIEHFEKQNFECAITLAAAAEGIIPPTDKPHFHQKAKAVSEKLEGTGGATGANDVINWLKHGTLKTKEDDKVVVKRVDNATILELEVLIAIYRAMSKFIAVYETPSPQMLSFVNTVAEKLSDKKSG